jgi:hypothetical protein
MMSWKALTAAFAAVLMLRSGAAVAQDKPASKAGCDQAQPSASVGAKTTAPPNIEGEVTNVDQVNRTVTVRASDGTTHQFRAHPEDVQNFKIGDHIEAKLRAQPNC